MFEYFYNEILRRTIISFGTLFNNISIKHEDSSDNVVSVVKVPLAYGPTQKFLARLEQSPDLNKPFAIKPAGWAISAKRMAPTLSAISRNFL